jgi:hypothetical protein
MEERERSHVQGLARVEHVSGEAADVLSGQQASEEVDVPRDLRKQHRDAHHAREKAALDPERQESGEQRDVRKPEEVPGSPVLEIDRGEERNERRIQIFNHSGIAGSVGITIQDRLWKIACSQRDFLRHELSHRGLQVPSSGCSTVSIPITCQFAPLAEVHNHHHISK